MTPLYWFTDSNRGSDWVPRLGYNAFFKQMLEELRERFTLSPSSTTWDGCEIGNDWIKIPDSTVVGKIRHLTWGEHFFRRGQPVFQLRFRLKVQLAWDTPEKEVFFSGELVIEFPVKYPTEPPRFFIDDPGYISAIPYPSWINQLPVNGELFFFKDMLTEDMTLIESIEAILEWIIKQSS